MCHSTEKSDFKIIFYDTGNSDAMLIYFSNTDVMLVDAGEFHNNSRNISKNLVRQLKSENVARIQKVIITHEHSDHYGGIFYLAKHVDIDTLIVSEKFTQSQIADDIKSDINFRDTVFFVVSDTFTYKHSDYQIMFIHPDADYTNRNPNNNSLVAKLIYQDINILLTGDIESEAEYHIVENYPGLLKSDILKVAHHGSKTSSREEFIRLVNPEVCVITANGNQKRGFPNRLTLETLDKYTRRVYTSGVDGAIVIEMNID
jgi:competence protein ComEC